MALAADCNLGPESFKVSGDTLGNHFDIKWLGDYFTAAASSRFFCQSLPLGEGKWKKQDVMGPLHPSTQVRKEVLAKKLQVHIGTYLSPENVRCEKETGTILVNRKKVVSVVIVDDTIARLDWSAPMASFLELDMRVIGY